MNTDKLNIAFNNNPRDKYQQLLDVNDVVVYCYDDKLVEGIILKILGNQLLLHNCNRLVDSNHVISINDIYKNKSLNITNIIDNYNSKLAENNMVYVFYSIYNDEDGLIFFKPEHKTDIGFITDYQKLLDKYPDIINFQFRQLQFYSDTYEYMYEHYLDVNKIIESYNINRRYDIFIPSILTNNKYTGLSFYINECYKINIKFNKNIWFNKLHFPIEFNKFIPIDFNVTLDKQISLELGNNSITNPLSKSEDYYLSILNFYEMLRLFWNKVVPTIVKKFNSIEKSHQSIFDCYHQLNQLKFKQKYIKI